MIQKLLLPLLIILVLQACGNDSPEQAATAADAEMADDSAASLENLKENAVDESDYLGRVRATAQKIQATYQETKGKMPDRGDVTLNIDDNFNLTIQNDLNGDIFKTEVNLKNLNGEEGGMMLLPDSKPGEYPGLRLLVADGKQGVKIYKNGKLEKEERYLDIYMPQRNHIEAIAPAWASILNVVHHKTE